VPASVTLTIVFDLLWAVPDRLARIVDSFVRVLPHWSVYYCDISLGDSLDPPLFPFSLLDYRRPPARVFYCIHQSHSNRVLFRLRSALRSLILFQNWRPYELRPDQVFGQIGFGPPPPRCYCFYFISNGLLHRVSLALCRFQRLLDNFLISPRLFPIASILAVWFTHGSR